MELEVDIQRLARHLNRGDTALKLYTVSSPPEHPAGTVHRTKDEADAAEHH